MFNRLSVSFLLLLVGLSASAAKPKNVVIFIGDGMAMPQRMTANEFSVKSGRGNLAMNAMPFQATTRTCSATSLVTDSAAAATAIACGSKTYNGGIGVDSKGRRIESCAETAKSTGRKVGIVTTVTIDHATPSGFYAHRKNRGESYAIGLDMIASGFDFFAGGGHSRPNDMKNPLYRGDLRTLAEAAGYKVIREDVAAFRSLKPGDGKVWYLAVPKTLPDAIDADKWRTLPSLAEITAKAIEMLSDEERGFFLMVEGGRIDWSGHANDAATNLREVLALDDAVKVAIAFREKSPDTLVVVTGDHETGGMTMGFADAGYAFYMDRLTNQTCSAAAIVDFVRERSPKTLDDFKPLLTEKFGFDFSTTDTKHNPMALSEGERNRLSNALAHDLALYAKGKRDDEKYDAVKITRFATEVKSIFSHKCGIGWTSGHHTALPVLTTAIGPGAEAFSGFIDNTQISSKLKDLVR